jgi:hypothetical protein
VNYIFVFFPFFFFPLNDLEKVALIFVELIFTDFTNLSTFCPTSLLGDLDFKHSLTALVSYSLI